MRITKALVNRVALAIHDESDKAGACGNGCDHECEAFAAIEIVFSELRAEAKRRKGKGRGK